MIFSKLYSHYFYLLLYTFTSNRLLFNKLKNTKSIKYTIRLQRHGTKHKFKYYSL